MAGLVAALWQPERLHGANAFRCDACDRLVSAQRSVALLAPGPECLIVTLLRFAADGSKITSPVHVSPSLSIPICRAVAATHKVAAEADGGGATTADADATLIGSDAGAVGWDGEEGAGGGRRAEEYVLYGVVVHDGARVTGGHYVAAGCCSHCAATAAGALGEGWEGWRTWNDGRVSSATTREAAIAGACRGVQVRQLRVSRVVYGCAACADFAALSPRVYAARVCGSSVRHRA